MCCVTQSNFLVVPLHNEWIIIKVTKVEMHYEGLRSLPSPKSIRHSLSIIKDRKKSTAKTLTSIWRNWNWSRQKNSCQLRFRHIIFRPFSFEITSGGKSIIPNCSLSSGNHPTARRKMNEPVAVKLYIKALFSRRDSI